MGAEACFFDQPWGRVTRAVTEADQAWLLNEAAFRLRALGRLTEALEPMRTAVEMAKHASETAPDEHTRRHQSSEAARRASNLSELELTLGEVAGAVGDAEQSVTYADRSGEAFLKLMTRTTHADALHQAGRRAEADTRFRQAEQMQKEDQPDYPLLYSLQGFQYCDLLLAEAERAAWRQMQRSEVRGRRSELIKECRAVCQRAKKMFEWRVPNDSLLDIALDHLTLGRAALYEAILTNGSQATSHESLDAAVSGLRRAGQQDDLPRGLLTRAWLRFVEKNIDGCRADLDEAWEIAERGLMRLFMADICLHRARLFRDKAALAEAAKLIGKCGYHRRDEELADAEEAAKNW